MSITEPIPDVQYGKGDWQDYISNWREKDAEWLQERTILRYATATARTTDWGSPRAGQVTYNDATKQLEMWSAVRATWVGLQMYQYLTSVQDTSTGVNISHTGAAGRGLTLAPTLTSIDTAVNLTNGVFTTTTNNVAIQTPALKKVTLTTNATDLVSDTQVTVPGLKVSAGVLDATGRVTTVGALTATSVSTASLAITGAGSITGVGTLGVTTVNATTVNATGGGLINGTTFNAGYISNASGMVTQSGYLRGDANGVVLSYRNPSGGAVGTASLTVDTDYIRVRGGRGIPWHNAAGTHTSWISPTIVSSGDPGAANYPDGAIWVIP